MQPSTLRTSIGSNSPFSHLIECSFTSYTIKSEMEEVEIVEYLPRLAVRIEPSAPVRDEDLIRSIGVWWRKAMRIACGGDPYPPAIAVPHLLYPVKRSEARVIYGGPIQRWDFDELIAVNSAECTAEVNRVLQAGWFRRKPIEILCSGVNCKIHSWDLEHMKITPVVARRRELGPSRKLVSY